MKSNQIVIIGLAAVLLVTVLLVPSKVLPSALAQTNTTQTPIPENTGEELPLQSGDTDGLIIGAGAIVLIILIGVSISRVFTTSRPIDSPPPNQPD